MVSTLALLLRRNRLANVAAVTGSMPSIARNATKRSGSRDGQTGFVVSSPGSTAIASRVARNASAGACNPGRSQRTKPVASSARRATLGAGQDVSN